MNNTVNTYEDINIQLQNLPLINPSNLEKLRNSTINNPEYLVEIFESFLDDSKELLQSIEDSAATSNFSEYFTSVHSLKGLAGTLGFSKLFCALKAMDSHNKEKSFGTSVNYIPLLKTLLLNIEEYLQSEFIR